MSDRETRCVATNRDGYDCELSADHAGCHRSVIGQSDEQGAIPEVQWYESLYPPTTPGLEPVRRRGMTAPRETLRQLAERARDAAAEYEAEKKADRFGRSTLVGPLATISHNAREALHAALSPEVVIALLDAASLGEKLREAMVSLPGRRLTIAIRGAAALVEFEDRHWLTRNEATRKLEEALATALSQPPTGDSTHA